MDVVAFTSMSKEVSPQQVMQFIGSLFSVLDALVDVHGVAKYDTAGDAYIVVGGLLEEDEQGFKTLARRDGGGSRAAEAAAHAALRVLNFARDMLAKVQAVCDVWTVCHVLLAHPASGPHEHSLHCQQVSASRTCARVMACGCLDAATLICLHRPRWCTRAASARAGPWSCAWGCTQARW